MENGPAYSTYTIGVCNLSEKFFSDPNLVPLHVIRSFFSIMYPILVGVKFNPTFKYRFIGISTLTALSRLNQTQFSKNT